MAIETYALKGGRVGRERLKVLSRILRPQTLDLFRRIGIEQGARCLDVGCGSGDVTFDLAAIVGPEGQVIGSDLDDEKLALADEEARDRSLSNVAFVNADATANATSLNVFDFAYARQLICHVADPLHVLRQMVACIRPGGIVAVEDVDFTGYFSYPHCPELLLFMDYVRRTIAGRGGDADIGPRLPSLLRQAGLQSVEIAVAQLAATEGEVKTIQPLTLELYSEAIIADSLADAAEVERVARALYAFAADPHTVMSVPRFVQSWGVKPTA